MDDKHPTRDAAWHLTHSRPGKLLDYLDPCRPLSRQLDTLIRRFNDIQAFCASHNAGEDLISLRNALAFHLVKMSCWWDLAFCPRAVTGVRNPAFLTMVKEHAARSADDEAFLDLFTCQSYMRRGATDHILIIGHDMREPGLLFGLDGQRRFRFTLPGDPADPAWAQSGYRDFTSAWLAAWTCHCPGTGCCATLQQHLHAEREFGWAQRWNRRYFSKPYEKTAVVDYVQACAEASRCRTPFGCMVFGDVINRLAFDVISIAAHQKMTLPEMFSAAGAGDIVADAVPVVELQALSHIDHGLDPQLCPVAFDRPVAEWFSRRRSR